MAQMADQIQSTTGIILAGGQSRRMGQDKRRLRLWGATAPTLLEHTCAVLAPLCTATLVVFADAEDAAAWHLSGVQSVWDATPDAGVPAALVAGLQAMATPHALVVAADLPLLNADLLTALRDDPRPCDLLVPRALHTRTRNTWHAEPLHARYAQSCLPMLQAMVARGQRRITDLLAQVQMEWFEPEQTRQYDPHGYSFLNINTPSDLAQLQAVLHYEHNAE